MAIEERSGALDHLDDVIESVAREMTSGEPSGALRAAVLRRVSSQGGWGTGLRPWAVAAVAVAVLAGGVAIWPGGSDDRPVARLSPPAGQSRTPERADERPAPAGDAALASRNGELQRTVVSRFGGPARQVLANDVRDDPDRGDAVRVAPLEMAPIAITLLQPSGVDIEAVSGPATVAIRELDVVPLRLGEAEYGLVE
jgi:hypothetical protein